MTRRVPDLRQPFGEDAMSATLETVETYLSAAQSAFASGDYDTARRQIILGNMELAKLPAQSGLDGESDQYRSDFKSILAQIEAFQKKASRGTRRSIGREF